MPVPGVGVLSLGTWPFGTGAIGANLTTFGAGGGTVEGSVGTGLGIPAPGGEETSFASLGIFATG